MVTAFTLSKNIFEFTGTQNIFLKSYHYGTISTLTKYHEEPNILHLHGASGTFWTNTAARILSPSSNFGIRGGYRGCQLVE